MSSLVGALHRNWLAQYPPVATKTEDAVKFGILGAANIAPMALITPAKSHPQVIVQAVAARDKHRAAQYAKKHGIPQALESYQAILDDPNIDAVYIPLPNGLHFEWAMKALAKGKHVLLEKPSVSNATEAELLFRSPLLRKPGAPVLLEAFHYRFQPSWCYFLSLVDRAHVDSMYVRLGVPALFLKDQDIRFNYDLAGGAIMDVGTYTLSVCRDVFGAEPEECLSCSVEPISADPRVDGNFNARWRFPNGGTAEVEGGLRQPLRPGTLFPVLEVTHKPAAITDAGLPEGQTRFRTRKLTFHNWAISNFYHRIDIEDTYVVRRTDSQEVLKTWKEREQKKAYTFQEVGIDQPGEPYWLSYRHMLEQFVNRIKGREGSGLWVSHEDSIAQMKMIDLAYEKCGLPKRPTSQFRLPN